jgi:predicted Zn-dependent protease
MNTAPKSNAQRALFSEELTPLRESLTQILPLLEAEPDWYGSIYFEMKSSKTYAANLKQTQVSDHVTLGAVLRIYDGYTLYEEATDDLEHDRLKAFATQFVKRIRSQQPTEGLTKRIYHPATWKERLSHPLESEITTQIPKNVSAQQPVHFGIKFSKDPRTKSTTECFATLKSLIERCKETAAKLGLDPQEITYLMARQSLQVEESIFLDRETNMSQTLFRVSLGLTTMSGPDRTFLRIGGLGGLESIEVSQSDIDTLIQDLKNLKTAQRLHPGKYRVLFGPVLTGVLAHEAFGHSQEGDTCARGRSKAWDLHQSGQVVGNQHATILNNPAIFENGEDSYAAWGSYFFDEEGWLAQEQVLLDQGKLLAPMTNLTSAIRLGVPRTANGKRETWANGVYTRQTNTYFSPGDKTLDELMADLKNGFLALHPAGGMEDPKGMGIQVGISYLYEVKDGKLTGALFKGPAGGDIQMTGYTPDVLNSIVAKSKINVHSKEPDRAKHPYNDVGGCGKYHKEFVYAGCGGPYVLLDQVILG